jgi:hypothetical protein
MATVRSLPSSSALKHLFRKEAKGNRDASSYRQGLVREITKPEPKDGACPHIATCHFILGIFSEAFNMFQLAFAKNARTCARNRPGGRGVA